MAALTLCSVTAICPQKCVCSDGYVRLSCLNMDRKEFLEWNIDGSETNIMIMRESYLKASEIEEKFPNLDLLTFTYPRFIKENQEKSLTTVKTSYYSIWYYITIVPIVIVTCIMAYYENYIALRQYLNQIRFLVMVYQILRRIFNAAHRYIGKFMT